MRILFLILFVGPFATSTISAQSGPDSTQLKEFLRDFVLPLANKDMDRILEFTHFPLEGDWGHIIGLNSKEYEWSMDDFVKGYDKLVDNEIRECLKKLTYDQIAFVEIKDYGKQMVVYCSWMLGDFEKGLMFKFTEGSGNWKLTIIQGAG